LKIYITGILKEEFTVTEVHSEKIEASDNEKENACKPIIFH
jgi:hypothetical protein